MRNKIAVMVNMQNALQESMNPDWKTQGWPWWRACYMECSELVDHIGWKWWKHQEPNMDQARMELVDIFHFYLNQSIEEAGIEGTISFVENYYVEDMDLNTISLIKRTENLALYALQYKKINLTIFVRCCSLAGLSFDKLYEMYVCKNVLNTFRQDNGYKAGTYIKNWSLSNGELEDNEVLMEMANQMDFDSPTIGAELEDALTMYYSQVKEFNL